MGQAQDRRAFALEVVERLVEAGHEAVWAGGCVRDLLLGGDRVPDDYDIATDAVPDRVREIFGREFTHEVGAAFGVILVRDGGSQPPIEVATFRTEGAYGDGRHPDSVQFASRQEDARRRDFTIYLFQSFRCGHALLRQVAGKGGYGVMLRPHVDLFLGPWVRRVVSLLGVETPTEGFALD